MKTFLVIDSTIVPEAYLKVLAVKELLRKEPSKGISDAVREIGISRSTFYKYKDYIFSLSEGMAGSKATLSFLLMDERGILSSILQMLSSCDANILTINQDIPINKIANVSITIEISHLNRGIHDMIEEISALYGVAKCELLALE